MSRSFDPSAAPAIGRRYYRWFASYEIPFRPVDPVTYTETEGLKGYYAAYHDPAGRVVRFDKIRLVRLAKEPWTPPPSDPVDPGGMTFFASVPGPGDERKPGHRIPYPETEASDEFFVGVAESPEAPGLLMRLRREIAFTDTYTYWPNGEMRSRGKSAPDKASVCEYYDADGNRLDKQAAISNGTGTNGRGDVTQTVH